jgi:shikimate dehydrogenase
VLAPLLACRPAELLVANRTPARAEQLARSSPTSGRLGASGFAEIGARPLDLVINATSASLSGEVPDLPTGSAGTPSATTWPTARSDTPFLQWAESRGARRRHKGWGMLVEQAAESYLLWRGQRPATRAVLVALEAL